MSATGLKYDHGKLRYDLVPPTALMNVAEVLTFGANKYSDNNWKTVQPFESRYIAAAIRHIEAYRQGEIFDDESGLPHLAHASTCLMFLLQGNEEESDDS